jgi:hypothetical protein
MPNDKKSQFRNCIAVDGDGESSEIFCPVCGKGTMCTEHKCPHVLLIFSASTGDDGLSFDYTRRKLTAAVGRVREKYVGHLPEWEGRDMDPRAWEKFNKDKPPFPSPSMLACELGLNPDSTIVMCRRDVFGAPVFMELGYWAVVIEFPPAHDRLKREKPFPAHVDP